MLKTINKPLDSNSITIEEIEELIEEITYKKYISRLKGKLETPTQYNNRIQWIINCFPTYKKLSEITGSSHQYILDTASYVGWSDIKHDLNLLSNIKEDLIKKEKQIKANKVHLEVWEHNENSIKVDLDFITNDKKRILTEYNNTKSKKKKQKLKKELIELSSWESDLRNDFRISQSSHRTALGQTNNYKDITPDKLEIEQKGELTLNNNIQMESEEEKLERYANYFKRIDKPTNSNTSE